jgi:two-component system OmpR family response regulator
MSGVAPGRGGSILLVEDDESLAGLLARHLRARGYDIDVVPSTERAIDALTDGARPALILLDINLPGDTGWGLLRDPAYDAADRPPVVVVSATTVSPSRLREFGVAGLLPKPFPLETLVATVERVLNPIDDERSSNEA